MTTHVEPPDPLEEGGAPPSSAAVLERIDAGEIDTVICAMPDLWGRLVGKRVTGRTFLRAIAGHGVHASLYLFVVDMDMDPRPDYRVANWENGFPDCRLVPDLDTLRIVPWLERTAVVICDPHLGEGDERVEIGPRVILRRQLERAQALGVRLKCASELEFYLFKDSYEGAWERRYRELKPVSYYRSDYHTLQATKDDWFFSRVRALMDRAGIEIDSSKAEWGLGQYEVNLRYADALEMADRHILYKNGIKELAALQGMSATFMAKPWIDEIGSSCHVHASLWDAEGERPLGWEEEAEHHLSPIFRHFIAGQLAYGRELTVLLASNVNSYKRLLPGNFAGTQLAYGLDNRTCALRVVGAQEAMRLENRIPGADMNPYLGIAALVAAGLHGIEERLACPPPHVGNADADAGVPRVPSTFAEAIALFEGSAMARAALGEDVHAHLCNFFRHELAAFDHETVTDWELMRYFERI